MENRLPIFTDLFIQIANIQFYLHPVYRNTYINCLSQQTKSQWSQVTAYFWNRIWHRRSFVYQTHDIPLPLTSEQLPNEPRKYVTLPRYEFPAKSLSLSLSYGKQCARLDDVATFATSTIYLLLTDVECS